MAVRQYAINEKFEMNWVQRNQIRSDLEGIALVKIALGE